MFDVTGTIGSLPSEISVGKILSEKNDKKLIGRVVKFLQISKRRFKSLQKLEDEDSKIYFLNLYREEVENLLSKITGFQCRGVKITDPLTSHVACCIATYFKQCL